MKGPGQGPMWCRLDGSMELDACNALQFHWLEHYKGATCLGKGVVSDRGLASLPQDGEPGPGAQGHPGILNQAQIHLLVKASLLILLRILEISFQNC